MAEVEARSAAAFAARLADACATALEERFVAAILHGSLVLGGFAPGRSDVDVLVVGDEAGSLPDALGDVARAAPARVDLRVVAPATAAAPPRRPLVDLHLVLRPGCAPEVEATSKREPDMLVELALCRAHGRNLLGPAPAGLIAAIPAEWVLAVGDDRLRRWQEQTSAERAPYAELIALTACRIWRFAEERRFCSKTAAGEWALARAPSPLAIRHALAGRAGTRTAAIDDEALLGLLAASREALASVRRPG